MHILQHVDELINVSHYHQQAGRQPNPRIIPEDRECIELMTGGRGWIEVDNAWVELQPGDLVWQCAGDSTISRSDVANPYRCLAVTVAVKPGAPRSAPRLTRWNDLDEIRDFTRQAVRWGGDELIDRQAVLAWLYGRLLFQSRISERPDALANIPTSLEKTLALIDERYAEDLSLGDLAHAADWSMAHLHAEFKRHLDTTPHRYLIQRRLRTARELLVTADQHIADVACACGFSTGASFCRVFKKEVGSSPGDYRRLHRQR